MSRRTWLVGLLLLALGVLLGAGVPRLMATNARSALAVQAVAPRPPALPAPVTDREGIKFSCTPQEPAATPDLLSAGVPAVYAFYNLPETVAGGLSAATWRVDGGSSGPVPRSDIRRDLARPGRGTIILRPPKGRLLPGVYELELQTAQRSSRASFVAAMDAPAIMAQQAPADAVLFIPQHGVARGVGKNGEPLRPTSEVDGRERVYYVLRYQGAEPGMAIEVRWWTGETELKAARREVVLPSTSGWAHAWLQAEGGLPEGAYRVSAATSGDTQELARDAFTVR